MGTRKHKFAAAALLLAAPALPAVCAAEIYGWIDGSGVVTYSNLPPPRGVAVTQVIHEDPVSPKAQADAAHNAEVSALNDRIRLLEWERARPQPVVVDYPAAAPAPPAAFGCGPDGYYDCGQDLGPYYTTGLLPFYWGRNGQRYFYRPGGHRGPGAPAHISHAGGGSHASSR